jgi:hypothetical protein
MKSKILGYIISAIGVVGLAASTSAPIKEALPFLEPLSDLVLTIISLAVLIVGVWFISKGSKSLKELEVPIFRGKEVVGYRRISKKRK